MFEQDYVMRLIKEMIRAVLKLVFNIDMETPTTALLETREDKQQYNNLLELIDEGNIEEAEKSLQKKIEKRDNDGLALALMSYSYLNEKSDDFLEKNNYSRDDIKNSLEKIADIYGLSSIAKMFFTEI